MNFHPTFLNRYSLWLLSAALLALLVGLQYRLWQEWQQITHYEQQIASQREENERLLERNQLIEWDIADLKQGLEATEERARYDLGMVKEDEILYYIPHE